MVLQDGIERVTIPWARLHAVFIGGTDAFKFGAEAFAAARAAKMLGKWVHVGRVNTARRVSDWTGIADSIDGSGISRYDHMLEAGARADRGRAPTASDGRMTEFRPATAVGFTAMRGRRREKRPTGHISPAGRRSHGVNGTGNSRVVRSPRAAKILQNPHRLQPRAFRACLESIGVETGPPHRKRLFRAPATQLRPVVSGIPPKGGERPPQGTRVPDARWDPREGGTVCLKCLWPCVTLGERCRYGTERYAIQGSFRNMPNQPIWRSGASGSGRTRYTGSRGCSI